MIHYAKSMNKHIQKSVKQDIRNCLHMKFTTNHTLNVVLDPQMASLLLLVGLVVGASFTGVVVVCSLVMWMREHSCYCSMPCPCKDLSDHRMCGPHKRKWVRFCPYKMFMACHCRWKDECKLSHSEVIFRENRVMLQKKWQ